MKLAKREIALLALGSLLVVAAYAVLPHGLAALTLKKEGKAYVALTQESDYDLMNVQAARYREILDGRLLSGEVDTGEHRDGPALWPLLSAAMIAPFLYATGSVSGGVILSDAVFPVLIFLALFALIRELTARSLFAALAAAVLMLFPQLPLLVPPSSAGELSIVLNQFLPAPLGEPVASLSFLKRESFIPGAAFFIAALWLLFRAARAPRAFSRGVLFAGLAYGLLFYLYFYFWVFATIVLGLFSAVLFLSGDRRAAGKIAAAGLVGAVSSIPFWLNYAELAALPQYAELVERMGIEVGRVFRVELWKTYLLFASFALAAFLLVRKRDGNAAHFLAALALSGIVALNIHVLTGFSLQSDHWSGRVFLITNGVILSALLAAVLGLLEKRFGGRLPRAVPVSGAFILAVLSWNILGSQAALALASAEAHTVPEPLAASYAWLLGNTGNGSVVASPSLATNVDLAVFTHNRLFLARSQNTLASERELLERLYLAGKIFGVPGDFLLETLRTQQGIFYFFTARYRSRELDAYLRPERYAGYVLPEELGERIAAEYGSFRLPERMPYRLDYLFVGPRERAMPLDLDWLKDLPVLYDAGGVTIYRWSAENTES